MTDAHKWGLTVTRSETPGGHTISVAGRLSQANAPKLAGALEDDIAAGHREMVLDLSEVDYVSSAALEVLKQTSERLSQAGGRLLLSNPTPPVRVALELAGIPVAAR